MYNYFHSYYIVYKKSLKIYKNDIYFLVQDIYIFLSSILISSYLKGILSSYTYIISVKIYINMISFSQF